MDPEFGVPVLGPHTYPRIQHTVLNIENPKGFYFFYTLNPKNAEEKRVRNMNREKNRCKEGIRAIN